MQVLKTYDAETREHKIVITVNDEYLQTECKMHRLAHLICYDNALDILKDAILLAMGLEYGKSN